MRRIEVGFTCNNHCVFCAPGNLRERLPQNPKLASELSEVAEGDRVAFVGGEPTLFDELSSWVRQAKEHGAASVVVQTNARRLAEGLAELPGVQIDPMQVRTNIVIFALEHPKLQPAELVSRLDADGVRVLAIGGKRLRAVTHYEVDRAGIERSLVAFGAQLRA